MRKRLWCVLLTSLLLAVAASYSSADCAPYRSALHELNDALTETSQQIANGNAADDPEALREMQVVYEGLTILNGAKIGQSDVPDNMLSLLTAIRSQMDTLLAAPTPVGNVIQDFTRRMIDMLNDQVRRVLQGGRELRR